MREAKPLSLLVASDLMSRDVKTITADMPLRDAAKRLARSDIHGAPVVDGDGRCVGVLSVTDLARWVAGRGEIMAQSARTCGFQETYREPGGQETTMCILAAGVCPMQREREMPDGTTAVVCNEPNCVPTEWQMVDPEQRPGDVVRDFMTTTVVAAAPDSPVCELARMMLEREVHRLVVLDSERRPVGVVAVNDLLQVLAHPELVAGTGK